MTPINHEATTFRRVARRLSWARPDGASLGGMAEITELLGQARTGDRAALDRVFELLYPELRRAARLQGASPDATLTPTVLINELYLHLGRNRPLDVVDRRHFLACAARAMRHLAIDEARRGAAGKRGGDWTPVTLTDGFAEDSRPIDVLALDQALDALEAVDPEQRELVELHWFAGVDFVEIAALRGVNERTIRRGWLRARAFLAARLAPAAPDGSATET